MSQPTLWAILEVFNVGIGVKVYFLKGKKHRTLARPLKENHKKLQAVLFKNTACNFYFLYDNL